MATHTANSEGVEVSCPLCDWRGRRLGRHMRTEHGEEALRQAVLEAKLRGTPDPEIGARFGISFTHLQEIITADRGANVTVLAPPKRIKDWAPRDFAEETSTVWSFRQRGNWATHDGRYRGNWSPYIPRNVILKYSKPGDVVVDFFVGGGTTAVEAKLLRRRCIARDINPDALALAMDNCRFSPPGRLFEDQALPLFEPDFAVGDARDLAGIADASVDLICAHPPYAGIIKYSAGLPGDLSDLSIDDFVVEMRKVARESFRVLKPGAKCAILVGDARKEKHVVPIGFRTIRTFLDAGFVLHELVIKRQHNCKTTGFWHSRSIKHNFLLLAHEYLPIFEKPAAGHVSEQRSFFEAVMPHRCATLPVGCLDGRDVETTTVWMFPQVELESEIRRNLVARFGAGGASLIECALGAGQSGHPPVVPTGEPVLAYIGPPGGVTTDDDVASYLGTVSGIVDRVSKALRAGSFLVVDTRDVRINGQVRPLGLEVWERLAGEGRLAIKEVIVVVPKEAPHLVTKRHLAISHRYLLVFAIR